MQTAQYERVLKFDLSTVVRNMAGPSNPHKRLPTSDLAERGIAGKWEEVPGQMPDGAVIIAAITSCTNTSNPRNVIAAGLLARNANARGLTRKPWVKISLAPGSKAVQLYLEEAKLLTELEQLGFGIVAFACTTCNGMSGALDPKIQQEIIERDLYATAVLSGNRNFDGRIHPYAKQAFLASPPLVVAYAIAGTVRFDIEKDVLGTDNDGRPVTLKDIWPNDAEIDAIDREEREARALPQGVRADVHVQAWHSGEKISPLYDWRPQSTYIRRPPYWEGARWQAQRTLKGMRPLAVLGDNITTDHLSPSNAIMLDSAAGEYLAKMGLPEEDFNSYATHRGDHLTAQRATFANPTLINEMARRRWQGQERVAGAHRAGRQSRADVGSDRDLHGSQAAADHHRRCRLRPGLVARLGRERACVSPVSKPSSPKASSASTAPTSSAWACCRSSSSADVNRKTLGARRHRDLRCRRRAHAARNADARRSSARTASASKCR